MSSSRNQNKRPPGQVRQSQEKFINDNRKARPVVPLRFVRACRKGHIGDINWYSFVHHGDNGCRREHWIDERGTSGDLSEVWVRCECKAERPIIEATKPE